MSMSPERRRLLETLDAKIQAFAQTTGVPEQAVLNALSSNGPGSGNQVSPLPPHDVLNKLAKFAGYSDQNTTSNPRAASEGQQQQVANQLTLAAQHQKQQRSSLNAIPTYTR